MTKQQRMKAELRKMAVGGLGEPFSIRGKSRISGIVKSCADVNGHGNAKTKNSRSLDFIANFSYRSW